MRVFEAFSASLVLHAVALALPTGQVALVPGTLRVPDSTHQQAAALTVRLGPQSGSVPARVAAVPLKALVAPVMPVMAPRLDDRSSASEGSRGNEPAQANDLPRSALGIPVSRYYGAKEVSRRAQVVDDVTSSLPTEVERLPGSGRLVLILWIGATGVVEKVDLDQSSVDEPMKSAIAAQFRATRFRPAEIDGAAVKSRMKIEVFVRPLGNPPSG